MSDTRYQRATELLEAELGDELVALDQAQGQCFGFNGVATSVCDCWTPRSAGRAAGQALVLAHRLFETAVGDALRRRLEADRATRWLVRIALGRMLRGDPTEARFGTVMIHASHLLLARGWPDNWRELRRKARELWRKDTGMPASGKAD